MSVLIYWLVIRIYAIGLRIAALFHPKAKLFIAGRKGLIYSIRYALMNDRRARLWMHCASLGEFEQGRPLLERLREQYPDFAIVLTFFSPSGYEARKNYRGADYIFYLPLDSAYHAHRFLDTVQPQLCIFIKYELWYFYLAGIAKRGIPALLVSAIFRKEQPFFQWYGRLHRRMLHCFTHIFVQDERSEQLLNRIGIDDVSLSGDTRFDRVAEVTRQGVVIPEAEDFCRQHKIIVAGSTWKEDELFLAKLMRELPENWRLILVPHEVYEQRIEAIEEIFKGATIRWSEWTTGSEKRVLIIDTVGLLLRLYSYANVAWVGGGFGKEGVHNILEAAVYGIPVGFGPVFHKFMEAKELLALNGAVSTESPEAFARQVMSWENDRFSYEQICEIAENYVFSKTGATQKILDYIEEKNLLKTP